MKLKLIYQYTDDGTVTGTSVVADDYQLATGETFTLPPAGLNTPLKYDASTDKFTGADEPEVITQGAVVGPTSEQESLTAIAQKMADQQQHIASLEQALTALAQGGTKS